VAGIETFIQRVVVSKPIKKTKLTAKKLASAIFFALRPEIVSKAEQFGQQLMKENGVQKAVKIINEYIVTDNSSRG
jgi:hypothetical protein